MSVCLHQFHIVVITLVLILHVLHHHQLAKDQVVWLTINQLLILLSWSSRHVLDWIKLAIVRILISHMHLILHKWALSLLNMRCLISSLVELLLSVTWQWILLRLNQVVLGNSKLVIDVFHHALWIDTSFMVLLHSLIELIFMHLLPTPDTIVKHLCVLGLSIPLLLIIFGL